MGLTTGYARHTPNDPAGGILGILDPIGEKGAFNGGEIRYEHRHFLPLGPVLTLAHRAMGTLTFGDVPFFEQPKLGSSRTVRGLPPGSCPRRRPDSPERGTSLARHPGLRIPKPVFGGRSVHRRRTGVRPVGKPLDLQLEVRGRRGPARLLALRHYADRRGRIEQPSRALYPVLAGILTRFSTCVPGECLGNPRRAIPARSSGRSRPQICIPSIAPWLHTPQDPTSSCTFIRSWASSAISIASAARASGRRWETSEATFTVPD